METDRKAKKKLSLSSQILIAMGLGIVVGIFFGEYCAFLQIFGDAFIKLLQITILPYITISMILGIGGLTTDQAKIMARKAGILMLIFWAISFIMVLLLPLSFDVHIGDTLHCWFALPTDWSAEQALAVHDTLQALLQALWDHYETPLWNLLAAEAELAASTPPATPQATDTDTPADPSDDPIPF